jgi:hypothetical protein
VRANQSRASPSADVRASEATPGLMPEQAFPSARGERISPTRLGHSAFGSGMAHHAPHLPFAIPAGISSTGWKGVLRLDRRERGSRRGAAIRAGATVGFGPRLKFHTVLRQCGRDCRLLCPAEKVSQGMSRHDISSDRRPRRSRRTGAKA